MSERADRESIRHWCGWNFIAWHPLPGVGVAEVCGNGDLSSFQTRVFAGEEFHRPTADHRPQEIRSARETGAA